MSASRYRPAHGKALTRVSSYRSGLEEKIAAQLAAAGVDAEYEGRGCVIRYVTPKEVHRYTADFRLPNGIHVESKGIFDAADRKKHLLIREQNPHLDIRFVFTSSKTKLRKGSPTSYAAWCEKHGFQYADKLIPPEWLAEAGPRKRRKKP